MNDPRLKDAIARGTQAHQENRISDALMHYRAALDISPDDAEAMSLCGLALVQLGQNTRAMPLLHAAVRSEPGQPGFRMNLALGLQQSKQYELAQKEVRIVLNANPANANAWDRIGDLAARTGDEAGAAEAWVRAFSLNLSFVTPALKVARLQMESKRFDLALRILDSAISHNPGQTTLLALKCEALIEMRNWPELQTAAIAWLHVDPEGADAWRVAARASFEQGRHVEAMQSFAHVLATSPTAADFATYGSLSLHALEYVQAATALDRAEALDPDNASMLATRGLLHMYFGRFAEAEACCRRSLAIEPDHAPAYTTLSRLKRGHLSSDERQVLAKIANRGSASMDNRIPAAFAVAHAWDAQGDIDNAMAAYDAAHALARERDLQEYRSYDRDAVERRTTRIIELASITLPAVPVAPGLPRPIFVVGMPRSGTTLFESVLGAHSRVAAFGERATMQQILRSYLELDRTAQRVDAAVLQGWWTAYFEQLTIPRGVDHITDKHPLNFEAAALIAHLFTDACIVHTRRNPVETCLSIFRQEFNRHWSFAHRLDDIAHYYGQYARIVAHWERVLPDRFVTFQYEDLVDDFARVAPTLLQTCGLDWEDQCARFQETRRPIATFSSVQARDAVRTGNGRADRYAKHLSALTEGLQRAGVDLATGKLIA